MEKKLLFSGAIIALLLFSCGKGTEELTLDEIQIMQAAGNNEIINKTLYKPGPGEWDEGQSGGTWILSISNDPKTFNILTARDGDSTDAIAHLFMPLADYDPYKREFKPELAEFEVIPFPEEDRMDVVYTLRENLFWTTPDGLVKEPATSDDVIFWYNEIEGDSELQQPGYSSQFVDMPDGSMERVSIEKLDDRRFVFHFPRIIAEPILSTNMSFGPLYLYKPAKEAGGTNGVRDVLTVETDVITIPSIGEYYTVEYTPGVRLVLKRNPYFYKKDEQGNPLPYIEEKIIKIVGDKNTEYLLFKSGGKDSYRIRPEDLDEMINEENKDYDIYNGGESLGSSFISFNQNPDSMDPLVYSWFIQKEFRQAMSCMLNRPRIANQVYRGLAVPAHYFFAKANPMFDENIKNPYVYNVDKALELLNSIGIKQGDDGIMYDSQGNPVTFDFHLGAENNVSIDIANIFADDLKDIGINVNVRPIDFQKLVQMITETYDWQVTMAALGANYWPSGGSNVWQSSGNFHLWHPLQETPATDWEAKVDQLYNDGQFILDFDERKAIYDEYQKILLEQQPMLYIVYPMSFGAYRHGWGNIYFDTLGSPDGNRIYAIK